MAGKILDTRVVLMELSDVKVAPLLTDPTEGETTYGAFVDLAGVLSLQVSPEMVSKTLYGDSTVMDNYARTTSINFTVTNSVISYSGLKCILGGNVSTEGSDGTEKVTYSITEANATPGYFKLEGKWDYASTDGTVKDAHVVLYKCRLSEAPDFTINDSSGDSGDCSFTGVAMPTNGEGKWMDMTLNATAAAIGG